VSVCVVRFWFKGDKNGGKVFILEKKGGGGARGHDIVYQNQGEVRRHSQFNRSFFGFPVEKCDSLGVVMKGEERLGGGFTIERSPTLVVSRA